MNRMYNSRVNKGIYTVLLQSPFLGTKISFQISIRTGQAEVSCKWLFWRGHFQVNSLTRHTPSVTQKRGVECTHWGNLHSLLLTSDLKSEVKHSHTPSLTFINLRQNFTPLNDTPAHCTSVSLCFFKWKEREWDEDRVNPFAFMVMKTLLWSLSFAIWAIYLWYSPIHCCSEFTQLWRLPLRNP